MNTNIFENKTTLIFLPHEDDEINIAGGLLENLKNINCKIKIVYSTNGDFATESKYRIKEAIKSLKVLGVSKENIIFLGYSDQYSDGENHIYMSEKIWKSQKNIYRTNTPNNQDYHYLKHGNHAEFTKDNFLNDIQNAIEDIMPDIIISVDYDSHADHRALSLSVEKALGRILNVKDYKPILLKGFAYPCSYWGYSDFQNINIPSTKFKKEEETYSPYQNPYFDFQKRVRFEVGKRTRKKVLLLNPLYYATLKHKSQFILNKIYSVINNDQVYFKRNTNNLCLKAKIWASSGEAKYLNDFMLFDCSNIMLYSKEQFNKGIFTFNDDDKEKMIKIKLNKIYKLDKLIIYTSIKCPNINEIIINKSKYTIQNNNFNKIEINLKEIMTDSIELKFKNNVEITELELNPEEISENYFKLCVNDNFIYNYYTNKDFTLDYYTNINQDEITLWKKEGKSITRLNSNEIKITSKKDFYILVYDKENHLLDKAKISYLNKKRKVIYSFIKKLNDFTILIGRCYQKIIRECRKINIFRRKF